MPDSRLSYLLKRHLSRDISKGESEELAALVLLAGEDGLNASLQDVWQEYRQQHALTDDRASGILATILQKDPMHVISPVHRVPFLRQRWMGWAAAVILLCGSIVWLERGRHPSTAPQTPPPVAQLSKDYIRNITLPDGSTVVLQAGSNIDYAPAFGDSSREVTLVGEAYFDIAHDEGRPFIIHTGTVSTTVLGTAFDIKAFPGQKNIVVSVTKGKVKVEDEHRLLAVLTPDQQLDYQTASAISSQQKVDANTLVTDWTKQDMVFEESSFAAVAAVLKKRYEVSIRFENEALRECPIHASFKGTEKLENVLNIVCKVQGATWRTAPDGTILISGKGCNK